MDELKNQTKTYFNPQKSFYTGFTQNQNNYLLRKNNLYKRKFTLGKFTIKFLPKTNSSFKLKKALKILWLKYVKKVEGDLKRVRERKSEVFHIF